MRLLKPPIQAGPVGLESNSFAVNIPQSQMETFLEAWIYNRKGKNDIIKGNTEAFLGDRERIIKASVSSSVCQHFHDKPFISALVFYQTMKPHVRL